jgi:hypothetical protein
MMAHWAVYLLKGPMLDDRAVHPGTSLTLGDKPVQSGDISRATVRPFIPVKAQ